MRRLALLFVIILLPPTGLSLYFGWDSFTEHKARAKVQVRQMASLAATYERKFFDDTRRNLQETAKDPKLFARSPSACQQAFTKALDKARELASLTLYTPEGQPICGSSTQLLPIADRPWFRDVLLYRNFTISDYTFAPESQYPVIVAALAVYDDSRVFQGILAAAIELHWLSSFIRDAVLPSDSVFFLLDSGGNVLADRSIYVDNANPALPRKTPSIFREDAVRDDLIEEIVSRRLIDFEAIGNDNVRRVYSSVALPHGDVTVLFGMPAAMAVGWLEWDLVTRVLGIAAIWLTAIGGAWLGTRHLVTRWTTSLRRMAIAYGRGDYSADLQLTDAPTELRDLGVTLMMMAERIDAREEELRRSIEQKDVLLREIHHRVKNNLQIITSLLNIHGKSFSHPQAREAIDEIRSRVRALALVHSYLYEGEDVQTVDMSPFMNELCHTMLASLADARGRISLRVDVQDLLVPSAKAVPIALLVTEAMTNSLKYAFPGGRTGTISVRLERRKPELAVLTIADDGLGLPDDDGIRTSLGFSLIKALAQQIGGHVTISSKSGTSVRVKIDAASFSQPRRVSEAPPKRIESKRSAA